MTSSSGTPEPGSDKTVRKVATLRAKGALLTLGAGIAWAGLYVNEVISFRDRSQRPRADGLAANAS